MPTTRGPELIYVYVAYATVAVGLVTWLARTLYQHGAVFLSDVFRNQPELAPAVNRLLVTGFVMLNLGWSALLLKARTAGDAIDGIEILANKLGLLLLLLAAVHFTNLLVLARLRAHARGQLAPPVAAQAYVAAPRPAEAR